MLFDANDEVENAGSAAAQSGIASARNANALPIPGPRLDADLEGIGALDGAFAVAHRAGRNILSCPMTARASYIELHPAARLLNRSLAVTLRTFPRSFDKIGRAHV